MSDEHEKNITSEVQEKIQSGKLKMKPKAFFVLQSTLYIIGAILVLGFTLYLASFIFFILRANGIMDLPRFGFRGYGVILTSLPWLLIILSIILVIILELLGKHFSFVYRWPLMYSLLGVVVVVLTFGVLVGQSRVHYSVLSRAENRSLPFAGPMYRHYGMMHLKDAHIGTVVHLATSTIQLQDRAGESYTVIIGPTVRYPLGNGIMEEDIIMVIGGTDGDTIQAVGIRKIEGDFIPVFRGRYGKQLKPLFSQ